MRIASLTALRLALACAALSLAGCAARPVRVAGAPERPLFAVMRTYKIQGREALARKVADSFVPMMQRQPGFVSYTVFWTGEDRWTALCVFETQAQAEATTPLARQWAQEHAPGRVFEPVIYEGPAVIQVMR